MNSTFLLNLFPITFSNIASTILPPSSAGIGNKFITKRVRLKFATKSAIPKIPNSFKKSIIKYKPTGPENVFTAVL